MKTRLGIFTLCLGLCCCSAATYAQSGSTTVVVRLYEIVGHRSLVISYGDGKTETAKAPGVINDKEQQESAAQIQQVIDRLYREGYHLVSSAGGGHSGGPVTTFIFRRKD